jgi:hypothetical protein
MQEFMWPSLLAMITTMPVSALQPLPRALVRLEHPMLQMKELGSQTTDLVLTSSRLEWVSYHLGSEAPNDEKCLWHFHSCSTCCRAFGLFLVPEPEYAVEAIAPKKGKDFILSIATSGVLSGLPPNTTNVSNFYI